MTEKEYKEKIKFVDWWYMMSDDNRVYRKGHKQVKEAFQIAKDDPKLLEIFNNKGQ